MNMSIPCEFGELELCKENVDKKDPDSISETGDIDSESTQRLLNSLQEVGTRNTQRLMNGIRRQSIQMKANRTENNMSHDLGTILEVPLSEVSVDAVLSKINPLGRFQQYVLLVIFCGAAPIVGLQNFVLVTQKEFPTWHCLTSHCSSLLTPDMDYHNETFLCSISRAEWNWDNFLYNSISQWDLACSKTRFILEMVFDFPGALIGALFVAYLADKIGRRLTYLVMLISTLTVGTMISSAKYFIAYVIFRLMMGITLTALNIVNYVWVLEHFCSSRRGVANAVYDIVRLSCIPLLALANVYIRSWNYLHLFSSITLLSGFIVYFVVPESPRWLLLKHRIDNAETILKNIASTNKERYPRRIGLNHPLIGRASSPCCEGTTCFDVITAKCCKTTIILLIILWANLTISEHALLSKVVQFNPNVNINESIHSAMSIPVIILSGIILCEMVGRRMAYILTSMFFLVCCILTILPVSLTTALSTAHFCPAIAIYVFCPAMVSILNLWAVEILPTSNRVCSFGMLVALRHVLKVAVPHFVSYADKQYWMCSIIISVITLLLSVAAAGMLHETRGTEMMEVQETETEYRNFGMLRDAFSKLHSQTNSTTSERHKPIQEWRRLSPILF